MTATTAAPGAAVRKHPDAQAMMDELAGHAAWLGAPRADGLRDLDPSLACRLTLHRCGELSCGTVASLAPADLPALRGVSAHVFVNHPQAFDPAFAVEGLASGMDKAGFSVHFRHGSATGVDSRVRHHGRIGSQEFLLSGRARLDAYPRISTGRARAEFAEPMRRRRAVAILDLVQDFEVLRPLLAHAAAVYSPFDLRVAVTKLMAKSPIWPEAKGFLDVLGIEYFSADWPSEVAAALGSSRSLLITASESSAAAHAFSHAVCRISSPKTLRVTMQHGFECIGLRHHRAHDLDFPGGVRFASDVVLTWDHPSGLPDLHPAEVHKCVQVGVIKATSQRAAALAEAAWQGGASAGAAPAGGPPRLLIAENLHSVRMRSPARHQRFLNFIRAAQQDPSVDLTLRSHPASRLLEQKSADSNLKFLTGTLRIDDLVPFDAFVSPPSTIILDAVLAGVPAAVWSDTAAFGDAANYRGLPTVTDFQEWLALASGDRRLQAAAAARWAVESTAALDGSPAAWNVLCQLMA